MIQVPKDSSKIHQKHKCTHNTIIAFKFIQSGINSGLLMGEKKCLHGEFLLDIRKIQTFIQELIIGYIVYAGH